MTVKSSPIPKDFFWRRLHSLMGLWLVVFLVEHLLTNSQAALVFGDDGGGFVKAVNGIKELPYITVIELSLIAVPFFIHIVWGIKYLMNSEPNSFKSEGNRPSLPQYPRNRAYTWQRITAWLLIIGVLAHVVHMRFIEYPSSARMGDQTYYMTRVVEDAGLYPLAKRLDVQIFDRAAVEQEKAELSKGSIKTEDNGAVSSFVKKITGVFSFTSSGSDIKDHGQQLLAEQKVRQKKEWVEALEKRSLGEGDVVAVSKNFGTAELLVVRDTFKSPAMIILYTALVLAAVYHAFNGFWTFLITWGVSLTEHSQNLMHKFAVFLMVVVGFLGLIAIWGTYWINLKM